MKLDPKNIRYLTTEDWRVLTAVEQGSRNHEIVPTQLISSLTNLRGGSQIHKSISTLAKSNLISRVANAAYDGYRLTYGGLDFLSLHAHLKSSAVYSIGNQIGVGKESDIYVVASPGGRRLVLKIHRLGRISFRTVKANRDYLRKGSSGSWMYMSRLAAMKEYEFMCALRNAGFPVPEPVAWNRHTVVMGLIDAFPLRQIAKVPDPPALYAQLIGLILRLARFGLIHADFNEFNILIEELGKSGKTIGQEEDEADESTKHSPQKVDDDGITLNPIIIDFPQTLSISHANAEFYFNRDVNCIKSFFERRFHFVPDEPGPFFADAIAEAGIGEGVRRLDLEVEASGFNKKLARELEKYMKEVGVDGDANGDADNDADNEANAADIDEEDEADNNQDSSLAPAKDRTPVEAISTPDPNIQAPSPANLSNNFKLLKLSERNLSNLQNNADTTGEKHPSAETIASKATRPHQVFSHTGTTSRRRPPPNPVKVAGGWAI